MLSPRSPEVVRSPAGGAPPSVEFQRQWQAGQQPRIETFLAQRPPISDSELGAIVRVDLRQRWRRGEQAATSDYLSRFPQLQADPALVVDLIYTEFLVREELGERAHLALLQGQFPQYAAELADQVEFHCALEGGALETRTPEKGAQTHPPQVIPATGAKPRTRLPSLGPGYEVLAEIGRGGMGIVYRARQVGLNRLVALKMVRGAEFASAELLDRFRAEAEAVARLHHPNIVQIFDYGEHDGLPYLALELVEGETLAARIGSLPETNSQPWPAREAAALVASLAVAVQFAHEQGVIHRDLKPANILLAARKKASESSSTSLQPGSSGPLNEIAKITDFGLAKVFRDDADGQTQTGSVLGTPSYMAPEQASGYGHIGPQADVYALGAILYELLAGRPPFREATAVATLQQVLNEQPVALRRLNPQVPRDLATICEKCLSKEPRSRYASAGGLASDLERFLNDRPIQARRISALERGWRWCRRNRALATLGTFVGVLLLAVATVSSLSSVRLGIELKQREQAQGAEREAKQTAQLRLWDAYLAEVKARTVSRQLGHRFAALETVDRASELLGQIGRTPERERQLRSAAIAALALPDLRRLRRIEGPAASAIACALSANRYVASSSTGDLTVRDLDGRELLHIEHRGVSVVPAISRDGRYIGINDNRGSKVWRIEGQQAVVAWEEVGASRLALAPDCRHAAVVGADRMMHWIDLDSGKEERKLGRGEARSSFSLHGPSRRIAVAGRESVQVISWETGAVLAELPLATAIPDVAWHPAGEHVAVSGEDGGVSLRHVASGRRVHTYPHFGVVKISFVGRGDYLLTHNIWDAHLSLWHTATGQQVLSDPTFAHFGVEQTADGKNLLFAKDATEATLWEIETAPACSALPHSFHSALGWRTSVAISPDGRLLMLGGAHGLELWDLETQQLAGRLECGQAFATFIDDGSIVARFDSGIWVWPRQQAPAPNESAYSQQQATRKIVFGPPRQLFGSTVDYKFATSPDGKLLVACAPGGWRVAGDATAAEVTLATTPHFDPRMVAMSHDAKWVALGSWNGDGVSIFSPGTGEQVAQVPTGLHAGPVFSPDNRLLATTPDGVRVWSTADWQQVSEVRARGDTASDLGIVFSPDSRVLAVSQPTGTTRLVDPSTGLDWAVLTHPDQNAGCYLRFSQNQRWLVTTSVKEDRAVRTWDLVLIRKELARRGLDWPADVLRASPGTPSQEPTSGQTTSPLEVSFERGPQWPKLEAAAMLSQTRTSRTAARRDFLARVLQVDPDCARALNELAWLLTTGPVELREAQAALTHARQAVAIEENKQEYLNTLGVALCRNAHYDEAIRVLERSLVLSVDEGPSFDLLFLALAYAGKGDAKMAREYHDGAKEWYDTRGRGLSAAWREEFTRLSEETGAAIVP
jgi:serine/threonine protein kinase/WD40 repeat protein